MSRFAPRGGGRIFHKVKGGGGRRERKRLTVEHGADGAIFREYARARSGGFGAGGGLEGGKRVCVSLSLGPREGRES